MVDLPCKELESGSRYGKTDVERWEQAFPADIEYFLRQLESDPTHRSVARGRGLSMLAGWFESMSSISIARKEFAQALGYFDCSVIMRSNLYRGFASGSDFDPGLLSMGDWQSLLFAFGSKNPHVMETFRSTFDLDLILRTQVASTKDSIYHSRLLKALSELRLDEALDILNEPQPKIERMFSGYVACMRAIARKDEPSFLGCLAEASDAWEKYAARHWKGLPESVCFVHGAGLVGLAEYVFGRRITVDDKNVPEELLGDVIPEYTDIASKALHGLSDK